MDERQITIQEMAEISGLSVHTLRYYERIGLLRNVARATNGRRYYTERETAQITFLNRLRATGMPIRQMQRFYELVLEGDHTIPERRKILEVHQKNVEAHIHTLQQNLEVICYKVQLYSEREAEARHQETTLELER